MMDCKKFYNSLGSYIASELSEEENLAMSEHMEHCENCINLYKYELKNYKELLSMETIDVPDFSSSRLEILNSIDKNRYRGGIMKRSTFHFRRNLSKYAAAVTTGAAVLVCVLALTHFKNTNPNNIKIAEAPNKEIVQPNMEITQANEEIAKSNETITEPNKEIIQPSKKVTPPANNEATNNQPTNPPVEAKIKPAAAEPPNNKVAQSFIATMQAEAYFGDWTVTKVAAFGPAGTFSNEDINKITGKKLTYAKDKASSLSDNLNSFGEVVANPVYEQSTKSQTDFITDWRVNFNQLGITSDSITEITVKSSDQIVGVLYLKEDGTLLANAGGVFFELKKQ